MNKQYGFIEPTPDPNDYKFGSSALPYDILMHDGDWRSHLPQFEHQRKNGVETQGCVSFGTLSALEMIHRVRYGTEPNYSDRYLAKMSNTTPYGNTPKKVADTLRNISGSVSEKDWPWGGNDWEDYYREVPDNVSKKGWLWTKSYDFGYEWVDPKDLKSALTHSPIGVAVYAWAKQDGVYVKRGGENHYCVLVAYEDDHPIIWDSYEEALKKLAKDYPFRWAMRYHLKKKPQVENYEKGRFWLWDIIKRLLGR